MPNVSSPQVDQIVEAINSALGSFAPESVVPGVEGLLENLHQIPEALSEAIKKFASRCESELPVNNAVADALREMVPSANTMAEGAGEAYTVFKNKHEQELDQHYNPRPGERAWNTN